MHGEGYTRVRSSKNAAVTPVGDLRMDPRHAILFEPVTVGPKVLRNRFYQVPHASGFGTRRPHAQAAFRAIKAEGGWGGVCVEYSPVSADAEEAPFIAADLRDERDANALAIVIDAIHAHGSLAGVELFHGGASSNNMLARHSRIAPSQSAVSSKWGSLPRTMTPDDIVRVQRDFTTAARRARDAGADIVYVYGAHGYLLTQFLSTATNQRTDGYGGTLANRARFQLETLEQVRSAIGDDCAIATRICIDGRDEVPGIHIDEMLDFVRMSDPLVDLFDVIVGSWPEDSGTSRYYPEGHQLPWSARVREATTKPIVGVGRFTSADQMAQVIRTGALDLIGAARPAIADPFIPAKIASGRVAEIRECTGSNICIMREESFGQIGCVQNATAGEEFRRGWHPEHAATTVDPSRPVLIIGAGPAGMECAVVLGRRGFNAVHLVDAADEIGGHLTWTRRLPSLGEWGRITDWRSTALAALDNVAVITGRRLCVDDVLDYGASIVIVATGSRWATDGSQAPAKQITGATRYLTPEAIMSGARPEGRSVVVYDGDGYFVAPGIAELLAAEGFAVHLVTPFSVVSPISDSTLEGRMLRQHLHDCGVAMTTNMTVRHRDAGSVSGTTQFGEPCSIAADDLVLVTRRIPENALHGALVAEPAALDRAGITNVHLIGDAAAPRLISESVFDGHRLAMEIDSVDPSVPWSVLREPPT